MSNEGSVQLEANYWGFLQALSDRKPAGPTEVETRMQKTGYSLSGTYAITKKLKQEGLVEHLQQQGEYRITPKGCAALDRLVYRMTRLMHYRRETD